MVYILADQMASVQIQMVLGFQGKRYMIFL